MLLLKTFFHILTAPLFALGYLIPKDDNLWVVGAWFGQKYSDNAKYLFESLERKPSFHAVWLTKNRNVQDTLTDRGSTVVDFYSWKCLYYCVRAKHVVNCVGYDDVSLYAYLFPAKTTYINLWHGTPLKKLEVKRTLLARAARRILVSWLRREADLVFASSPLSKSLLSQYFQIPDQNIVVTGYPRNDGLYIQETPKILNNLRKRVQFNKVAFFLPTFRDYPIQNKAFSFFDGYQFSLDELMSVLESHQAVLLVKLHYRERQQSPDLIQRLAKSNRIHIIPDGPHTDIYPVLAKTDVLITDYSSVYFDYLLLDRPTIFSAFDKDIYARVRGLNFEYDDVTPGPIASNWTALCRHLNDSFSQPTRHKADRRCISKQFNTYSDNQNCTRVLRYITKNKLHAPEISKKQNPSLAG